MPIFYGQSGEDNYIYNNYINKPDPNGTYVELGAIDGEIYSITKFFQDELNFNGILIEPTKHYQNLIKNRTKDICYNIGIHNEKEGIFMGENATAGLVNFMSDSIKRMNNYSQTYYVKCIPFNEIQKQTKIPYIDLFVLDVEGAEEIVLNTIDFSTPIYIMVIELDDNNKEKDERCREILRKNGFELDIRVCINEFWINKNYFRKDNLYDKNKPKYNLKSTNCKFPWVDPTHYCIPEIEKSLNK
jgi:hypothetical protein